MNRRGFVKMLGLSPAIVLLPKKSRVDKAMDDITKRIDPESNKSMVSIHHYFMITLLAKNASDTLDRIGENIYIKRKGL